MATDYHTQINRSESKAFSLLSYEKRHFWMANASGFHADHFTILIDSVLYYVYMGHMIDGILKKYWQWRPIASNSIYYTLSKIEMVIDFLNKSDNYAGLAPKQIAKQLLTDLNDVQTR